MVNRGCLYWAKTRGGKVRPVLVVSPESRNELSSDILVCPVSTNLRGGPWHVRLRKGQAGVPKQSTIQCEQITTIEKSRILPDMLGGPLSQKKMLEVETAIMLAIGVVPI